MGITGSSPATISVSAEDEDIQFLGQRMPYGDTELLHIYRAYQTIKSNHLLPAESRTTFLIDIGVACAHPSTQEERAILLQAVEAKLLPPNFGNELYKVAFLNSNAESEYDNEKMSSSSQSSPESLQPLDSYHRRNHLESFFDGLSNCSRRGNEKALKVLFDCCQPQTPVEEEGTTGSSSLSSSLALGTTNLDKSNSPTVVDPMELVEIAYRIGLASAFLSATSNEDYRDLMHFFPEGENKDTLHPENLTGLKALARSIIDFCNKRKQRLYYTSDPKTTYVSFEEVKEWAEHSAPMLGAALSTFTHALFFPHKANSTTRTSFDFPNLAEFSSAFISQGSSSLLFSLACMSPALGGEYYRLYTSASDGLSFNRLQNALLGYGGPTLILIQSGKSVFGAFTASPWKESKGFYGNHDCFLYQLLPTTTVCQPSGKACNFMYCNSHARSRGYDQQAHGIGFGGSTDQPRLFISESFDNCQASAQDMTFESGQLLDGTDVAFDIDALEVWGVGGTAVVEEALGARSRQRDIKNAAIKKARKVDKAQFLDDFRSGMIESKAFQHREQIRGNAGAALDEGNTKK